MDGTGEEALITKLQIEYTLGTSIEIAEGETEWDIGLLYLTTQNLWFVNPQAERTQVSFDSILTVDAITPAPEGVRTKYTEVLQADHRLKIDFESADDHTARAIVISASMAVLKAFRTHLDHHLDSTKASVKEYNTYTVPQPATAKTPVLTREEMLRQLSALLYLEIKEDKKLEYFLQIDEKDLINLLIEHTTIMNK